MNIDTATALLEALGTKLDSHSSSWARAKCPLAPFLHQKGKDSSPSFGVSIDDSAPRFHCFTCESGSLSHLLQIIEFRNQQTPGNFHGDLNKAREIVENAESELPMLPAYSEFGTQKTKVFEELPLEFLDSFFPVAANPRSHAYCTHRGFSDLEMLQYELRYDPERDMVVFPYWDVFGRFAGVRGRRITLNGESKSQGAGHHDYVVNGINNSGFTFYNEQALNLPGPVVVVEGQVDCIKVARIWPKTVGNLTAKPIMSKVQKLGQSDGVVLLLDGDSTGRVGTEKFSHLLQFLNIKVLPILLPWDESTGVKSDPDSIGPDWLTNKFKEVGLFS
jgi:hypothetical protein